MAPQPHPDGERLLTNYTERLCFGEWMVCCFCDRRLRRRGGHEISVASFSARARGDNGQIAGGILGGLAAGTILGAATAPRRYYAPPPICVEPTLVCVQPRCYWTPGLGRLARSLGTFPRESLRLTYNERGILAIVQLLCVNKR